MVTITADQFIKAVLDEGSFKSWDEPPTYEDISPGYAAQLERALERSGHDESVVTGRGTLHGTAVAVIAGEFNFLAGTIGRAASERIVRAFEHARLEGLPVLASPISGGTRMQEGTHAFLQLVKIAGALRSFRRAGLPYLVYVRSPMTGGPVVSWGSLGQVTFAEPSALMGLLGPRVVEVLTGAPLPEGVQSPENLLGHGVIDGVVDIADLREGFSSVLRVTSPPHSREKPPVEDFIPPSNPAWDAIEVVSQPQRLRLTDLISRHAEEYVPLLGTDLPTYSGGVRAGLSRFAGFSCMLLGHEGGNPSDILTLEGLSVIQRGAAIAGEMGLPVVTIVDTPGVEVTVASEEGGMAREIARTVEALLGCPSPVVSVILGAGTGVSSLTLLPSDRAVCAENAFIVPLPPEAASEILHRTAERAPELAEAQGIRSIDLLQTGLIDLVVPEDQPDPSGFSSRLLDAIAHMLAQIVDQSTEERLELRHARYRRVY